MATAEEGSHYFVDNAADPKKGIVKLRPPAIYLEPHLMPAPSPVPWNSSEMPWTTPEGSYQRVMQFHAAETPHCSRTFTSSTASPITYKSVSKRKASVYMAVPPKQHITEEKMAEHLSSLHISPNYTSHQNTSGYLSQRDSAKAISSRPSTSSNFESMDSDNITIGGGSAMNSSMDSEFSIMSQDLEQKLKNAQRITICEQIRKLANEPLIPKALMERMERPCTALVLWRPPPQNLSDFIQARKRDDEDQDNNNSFLSINMNSCNSMDLDL